MYYSRIRLSPPSSLSSDIPFVLSSSKKYPSSAEGNKKLLAFAKADPTRPFIHLSLSFGFSHIEWDGEGASERERSDGGDGYASVLVAVAVVLAKECHCHCHCLCHAIRKFPREISCMEHKRPVSRLFPH